MAACSLLFNKAHAHAVSSMALLTPAAAAVTPVAALLTPAVASVAAAGAEAGAEVGAETGTDCCGTSDVRGGRCHCGGGGRDGAGAEDPAAQRAAAAAAALTTAVGVSGSALGEPTSEMPVTEQLRLQACVKRA